MTQTHKDTYTHTHTHVHTHTHTHTLGRNHMENESAHQKDLYLTTHSTHNRQTLIRAYEWSHTHAFNYATARIGLKTPGLGIIIRTSL